jgi:hypothetical protein
MIDLKDAVPRNQPGAASVSGLYHSNLGQPNDACPRTYSIHLSQIQVCHPETESEHLYTLGYFDSPHA